MMELIRINHKDIEELRLLLMYYQENEMDIEDINKIIIFMGKKYGFDPFSCAINVLTGMVSERKKTFSIYDAPPVLKKIKPEKNDMTKKPVIEDNADLTLDTENENIHVIEKGEDFTKILINGKKTHNVKKDPKEYLSDLERWIKTNDLNYMKVRKMISDLAYIKRMKEITPNLVSENAEYLIEFQQWIESRDLSYLNIRMMLALLAQKEENGKRETLIAR